MDEKSALIVGLILLSIGLCYKIAQLFHRLGLSNKENESLIKKNFESESNLKKEIASLKKTIADIKKKHAKEISSLTTKHGQEMAKLIGQQLTDELNSIDEPDS